MYSKPLALPVDSIVTGGVVLIQPADPWIRFVKPEVANNPTVFLSDADMKLMAPPDSLSNDLRRLMTRTFTSFKTGL